MFLAAARALADFVTAEQIEKGQLYPEAKDLRKVAATVGDWPSCSKPLPKQDPSAKQAPAWRSWPGQFILMSKVCLFGTFMQ